LHLPERPKKEHGKINKQNSDVLSSTAVHNMIENERINDMRINFEAHRAIVSREKKKRKKSKPCIFGKDADRIENAR
jgi:hypothetical protein